MFIVSAGPHKERYHATLPAFNSTRGAVEFAVSGLENTWVASKHGLVFLSDANGFEGDNWIHVRALDAPRGDAQAGSWKMKVVCSGVTVEGSYGGPRAFEKSETHKVRILWGDRRIRLLLDGHEYRRLDLPADLVIHGLDVQIGTTPRDAQDPPYKGAIFTDIFVGDEPRPAPPPPPPPPPPPQEAAMHFTFEPFEVPAEGGDITVTVHATPSGVTPPPPPTGDAATREQIIAAYLSEFPWRPAPGYDEGGVQHYLGLHIPIAEIIALLRASPEYLEHHPGPPPPPLPPGVSNWPGPGPEPTHAEIKLLDWRSQEVWTWPETSQITRCSLVGGGVTLDHTKKNEWPEKLVPTVEHGMFAANAWFIVKKGGQWLAHTFTWMGRGVSDLGYSGHAGSSLGMVANHNGSDIGDWVPKAGEVFGFFVSTLFRFTERTINERSNIFWLTAKDNENAEGGTPAPPPPPPPPPTGDGATREEITAAYLDLLGRPADEPGVLHYLALGWPIAQVREDMLRGPEYFKKHTKTVGSTDQTGFFSLLYDPTASEVIAGTYGDPKSYALRAGNVWHEYRGGALATAGESLFGMCHFKGAVYGTTEKTGKVFRLNRAHDGWDLAFQAPSDGWDNAYGICEFGGYIFTMFNNFNGGRASDRTLICRSADGSNWHTYPIAGWNSIRGLVVFQGALYAHGEFGGRTDMRRLTDPLSQTWEPVWKGPQSYPGGGLVIGNVLYLSAENAHAPADLIAYDGTTVRTVWSVPAGKGQAISSGFKPLARHKNILYLITGAGWRVTSGHSMVWASAVGDYEHGWHQVAEVSEHEGWCLESDGVALYWATRSEDGHGHVYRTEV